MKKTVCGDGMSRCLLCGEQLGSPGVSSVVCEDCKKVGNESDTLLWCNSHKSWGNIIGHGPWAGTLYFLLSCRTCVPSVVHSVAVGHAPSGYARSAENSERWVFWTNWRIIRRIVCLESLWHISSVLSQVWKRSGAWFFKGFPKHFLPSPMPLSKVKDDAAEPQAPPAPGPREAVAQPQAPGRHSQGGARSALVCWSKLKVLSTTLWDCCHKQLVYIVSLSQVRLSQLDFFCLWADFRQLSSSLKCFWYFHFHWCLTFKFADLFLCKFYKKRGINASSLHFPWQTDSLCCHETSCQFPWCATDWRIPYCILENLFQHLGRPIVLHLCFQLQSHQSLQKERLSHDAQTFSYKLTFWQKRLFDWRLESLEEVIKSRTEVSRWLKQKLVSRLANVPSALAAETHTEDWRVEAVILCPEI